MSDFAMLDKDELKKKLISLNMEYESFKARNFKLDMTRGRPCKEQLDLSVEMLNFPGSSDSFETAGGVDIRNYGVADGIPEAKELFSKMLEVNSNEIIIGGNSSLSMMYDSIVRAMMFGVFNSPKPWCKLPKVKFLCPSPGYDRHFAITEAFGFEMITIDMNTSGPDMDAVERLAAQDPLIKGIWCTPIYSNPDGITYSGEVVDRLAAMKTAAPDFRIFWDEAYVVHHLTDSPDKLKNIMEACKKAGNPDRAFIFASTSKITFSGSGVAMMAASENNIKLINKQIALKTIGPDKINQMRHVRFLKDMDGITAHMKKHAAILKPKFDMVLDIFDKELSGKNIACWNRPNGGYFISFYTMPGCASSVVKMAADAGVAITSAGATYPYGRDPQNRNIRIAPSLPPVNELKTAVELFCICVEIVSLEKLLSEA